MLVLLSLGFVMILSASAFAVDVKVGAEYYAGGVYLNRIDVSGGHNGYDDADNFDHQSTAFFFQRLRVGTDFIVSPGLKLVTRFDAMQRIWGGARSNPSYNGYYYNADDSGYNYAVSAGRRAEAENIAFDLAYVQYASPVGTFNVGYQIDGTWGTVFGDSSMPQGMIGWSLQKGAFTYLAQFVKVSDESASAVNTGVTTTDLDYDKYIAGLIYGWKGGEAGARLSFVRSATWKADGYPNGSLIDVLSLNPYVKTKIGPVTVQAEVNYFWGYEKGEDSGTTYNAKYEAFNVFVDAAANFGMFNVGGTVAYLTGDNPATDDKKEGGYYANYYSAVYGGGLDWNPCLIMFNSDVVNYWVGGINSNHNDDNVGGPMNNALFLQGRIGVKPTPQWDVLLSLSYAQADKKPEDYVGGTYGTEVDLTATYKITNNLSYMIGAGYLFTGDYFKGECDNGIVKDDFIVINKLTLNF